MTRPSFPVGTIPQERMGKHNSEQLFRIVFVRRREASIAPRAHGLGYCAPLTAPALAMMKPMNCSTVIFWPLRSLRVGVVQLGYHSLPTRVASWVRPPCRGPSRRPFGTVARGLRVANATNCACRRTRRQSSAWTGSGWRQAARPFACPTQPAADHGHRLGQVQQQVEPAFAVAVFSDRFSAPGAAWRPATVDLASARSARLRQLQFRGRFARGGSGFSGCILS